MDERNLALLKYRVCTYSIEQKKNCVKPNTRVLILFKLYILVVAKLNLTAIRTVNEGKGGKKQVERENSLILK